MKKLEKKIEDAFVEYALTKRCLALKLVLLNRRGFPDRTILLPFGRILFIEFKAPGEKPTMNQIEWGIKIAALGHLHYFCDDLADAKAILDGILKGENR